MASCSAGRPVWRRAATARSTCPTTTRASSIGSRTPDDRPAIVGRPAAPSLELPRRARHPGPGSRPYHVECAVRHVTVERDRTEVLEAIGFVEIDGVARLVEINQLAVRTRPDRHARTPRELDHALAPLPEEVDGPQFVVADRLQQGVGALPIAAQRKAQLSLLRRGTEREVVKALLVQIDPPDN